MVEEASFDPPVFQLFTPEQFLTSSLHGSREGRKLKCSLCGRETTTTYRRVIGWERKASSVSTRKGGSDILLREPLEEFACAECITRLRAGVNAQQESLV